MPILNRVEAAPQDVMFHVTRVEFLQSIKRKGLNPAAKSVHSDNFWGWKVNAIYFSSSELAALQWVVKLATENGRKTALPSLLREYCILKVDVSEWKKALRRDPDTQFRKNFDAYYLENVVVPAANVKLLIPVDDAVLTSMLDPMPWVGADLVSIINWNRNGEDEVKELWSVLSPKSQTRIMQSVHTNIRDCEDLVKQGRTDFKRNIPEFKRVLRILK